MNIIIIIYNNLLQNVTCINNYFRVCLDLIEDDNVKIKEEYDLIKSLQILNEFNVDILPLQVRLTVDRLTLIEHCLNNQKDAYKSRQKLLTLATYLRIEGNNNRLREGKISELIAKKALEVRYIFFLYVFFYDLTSRIL